MSKTKSGRRGTKEKPLVQSEGSSVGRRAPPLLLLLGTSFTASICWLTIKRLWRTRSWTAGGATGTRPWTCCSSTVSWASVCSGRLRGWTEPRPSCSQDAAKDTLGRLKMVESEMECLKRRGRLS
ncbi:hypothetical protein SKAU_G00300250 [Synaphobranchus kaupii]|uniref:Uncharacterized protein n=1 Tax=Synaphobranchus kaupii TaxID=118154 RepID=A0A9Q1EVG3_SYNKA|nr:hypothetical protein SKAU_G00300250 [Synaphobranchus kaupii]